MNDECGVHDRGLRADAVHQAAVAPAVLRGSAARRRGWTRPMDLLMYELVISDRSKILPIVFKLAEQVEPRARHQDPAHVAALAAERPGPLRRGLQRGLERELGLRALQRSATSTSTRRRCSSSSTATGSWSPRRPTARRRRSRITFPDINQVLMKMKGRLLPFGWWHFLRKAKIDRPGSSRLPRRQARLPAHGGRGGAVRRALRHRHAHAAEVGRDGLDPRDQPQHEPRHGGDGRPRSCGVFGSTNGFCKVPVDGSLASS